MQKTPTLILSMFLSMQFCAAQTVNFLKTYGDAGPYSEARDIITFTDGTSLIAATVSKTVTSGGQQTDILLIKINASGDTIWTSQVGNVSENEHAESIIVLPDSKIMIAGNTTLSSANTDAILICTDATGHQVWRKNYGGSGLDGFNVIKKMDNGYILGGTTDSYGAGDGDAWLVRTNNTGDTTWTKTFGGSAYDDCWDLELTPEKGFLFTGGTYSFANGANDDAWLVKTDTAGNMIWRKTYGLQDRVDWSWSLTPVTTAGNITGYAFVGIKNTGTGNPGATLGDLHFVKVDVAGNVIWDKSIDQPVGSYRKEGTDIIQTKDGGFVISGYQYTTSARQLYIIKANEYGDVIWDTSFGNQEAYAGWAVAESNNDIIITGSRASGPNTQNIFAVKISNVPTTDISTPIFNNAIAVYPNPANDQVTIQSRRHISGIELFDVWGRKLQANSYNNVSIASIPLTGVVKGTLLLKIITIDGIAYKKVIRE